MRQAIIDKAAVRVVHWLASNEAPNDLKSLFKRLSDNAVRELQSTKIDLELPLLKTSSGQS